MVVDGKAGTPVALGVVQDVFDAFGPDEEQWLLFSAVSGVAEKLGLDFRNGNWLWYENSIGMQMRCRTPHELPQ